MTESTIGRCIWGSWSVVVLLLIGCTSAPVQSSSSSTAQRLLGKSQTQILQCAGKPARQTSYGANEVVLRYYKEAPMFEESDPISKGSLPALHHGCWASLLIENEQVTGVEFRTVPEGAEKEDDECEEIFRQCVP
jgi:hypothetical protein